MPQRIRYFLLGLLAPFALLTAQPEASFRHLSKQQGLSQNSVFAIAQDGMGLMWFGTRNGLNKYDGNRITTYLNEQNAANSLVYNDIRTLYHDASANQLWIGTASGLSRYRPESDDFTSYGAGRGFPSAGFVHAIYQDAQGRLWVGTEEGLFGYRADADYFQLVGQPGTAVGQIQAIVASPAGQLYVGTSRGLYQLSADEKRLEPSGPSGILSSLFIQALHCTAEGEVWIGTRNNGIYRWRYTDGQVKQLVHDPADPHSLSSDNVRDIVVGHDGHLWVGTFAGLNRYAPGREKFTRYVEDPTSGTSLSSNSIHALYIDRRGSLWVGTYYGGVDFHDDQRHRFLNFQQRHNGLSNDVVSAFLEDPDGGIWIGTEGGGLNYFNRQDGRIQKIIPKNGALGDNLKTLLLDGNAIWVGAYQHGLSRLDLNTLEITASYRQGSRGLTNDNVYDVVRHHDTMWVATHGGGIDRIGPGGKALPAIRHRADRESSLASDNCRAMLLDRRGQLWVATDRGLDLLSDTGTEAFRHFFPQQRIYCIAESYDGLIWVGTYSEGLYALNNDGELQAHYSRAEGIPGNTILAIVEDDSGQLWCSTNLGLARLNRQDNTFQTYDHLDGLENQEFNFNAAGKTRRGELLFGGLEGFTLFHPDAIRSNPEPPEVVFTGLKQFGQPVIPGADDGLLSGPLDGVSTLVFPYNEANFSIAFAALDYLNPSKNLYAYRLEGLDREWVQQRGNTEASYTIQSPGEYRFYVKAANGDGVWNHQARELLIRVLPPPWRTGWAYLVYALLAALLLFSVTRYYHLRNRLKLERMAKAQQEELHQTKLRFFTNIAHEIRTPLTLIVGPLEDLTSSGEGSAETQRRLQSVARNTRHLLKLVNQLLTFRKLDSGHDTLELRRLDLIASAREVYAAFAEQAIAGNITYRFLVAEPTLFVPFDADKLEKILFNLLANAFKAVGENGRVDLEIRRNGSEAEIKVSDDGPGIPREIQEQIFLRFFERETNARHTGTGIGLAICRQLVELHQGNIWVDSAPGAGSTFAFTLPLRGAAVGTGTSSPPTPAPLPPSPAALAPAVNGQEKLRILVVEDNREVLAYLVSELREEYRVLTAPNGRAALELAVKNPPDLVVSDVMMPEMDGLELCTALKSDPRTSHLPVLLLTARSADDFKLEGLAKGADDYLTKPFSPRELKLRIRNTLASARTSREKITRALRLEPTVLNIASADEVFLEKALAVAEANIARPGYKVDRFARDLAVSRALLFARLKEISGHTPNNFIKLIRMKRAAQLLRDGDLNVNEVATRVGFKDTRYFTKCFRSTFGTAPTDYREQVKAGADAGAGDR
ncbi:two-component regulator propeller domain-containing protein [Neolewinella lacunae]|uniref:histidine kinase n=1 Tax=Neolewinella lacunae TaxID=1517758 RepID=A0A923T7I0_9BACT|nr:two-component regulator propeller domain-containing protein [Neolewinella lacunae]MBC6994525.1 response regulator [Neolewinella lacunae]MDN3634218.1 two-component regulator propeller domain-containing protein [Neolewinella lacunae]